MRVILVKDFFPHQRIRFLNLNFFYDFQCESNSYLKYSMSILKHTLLKIKVLQSDAIGEPL